MEQKFIELFDRFTHGGMQRRAFLERLAAMAGSAAAANGLLAVLENNYAQAAQVAENDPRLEAGPAKLAEGASGYLVKPAGAGKLAAVMVIHENRGLNPHIKDVTRRLALEGFLAFAPDYLAGRGGTPADEDKARDLIGTLTESEILATSQASLQALNSYGEATGKTGAIGFCWGGGQVNALAVAAPTLAAGVVYYGMQPAAAEVAKIAAPLLLHYAGLDSRINAGIADFEAALKANRKTYELYMYEGANHAFNNDSNAARYNKAAADLAWARTVAFLKKYLG
ncbi:MAG: dienelactone hydrolase family protein [Rhizobiales bacterium]|nr:dienelactone hydrolase family protein [Hyphomicrobiales bacterium]MBI3673584.1 dienelactone hydrolase family protein [Hyphomicrobiales bacterium]